ncbi:8351_t:CDS:2, partial [Racocetra persica]
SGDGGRDIIVEIYGYRIVVQCKAWFKNSIGQNEADELKTVVREGNFDFGILVGVLEEKIALGAYKSAERSGGDIIVTLYTRMCRDIKMLIA